MRKAACTIVSSNYLPYARTLCSSFHKFHPEYEFFVLLADRPPEGFIASAEPYRLILAEDLGIPNFREIAFKFGIVELNTNVKPTFLQSLLESGIDQLIFFDPDILICSPLDVVYQSLHGSSIVLTPHATSPNEQNVYDDVLFLMNGAFNLGFIALSNTAETMRFLKWWEDRCLSLGYNERWAGLFVDQKWTNLVPCYFETVEILKHPGCNVAYWNLHERTIMKKETLWTVNGSEPLIFFHFSGVTIDGGTRISKHGDQFDLSIRPELEELFEGYRNSLSENGIANLGQHRYAFGYFDDGTPINKLQRALFAANLDKFGYTDPFAVSGSFYPWAKKMHLQSKSDSVNRYGRKAYKKEVSRVRLINKTLRLLLRIIGADRYTILMKYLEYISLLRNQKDVFTDR